MNKPLNKPPTSTPFESLQSLAEKFRQDLNPNEGSNTKSTKSTKENDFVLLFAHNGVGKTRLSMEFKALGKQGEKPDTLYFNAFTEDLFDWDNDLDDDTARKIKFKARSRFFKDLDGLGIEDRIRPLLHRHADFDFRIDYEEDEIGFHRNITVGGNRSRIDYIKISRGEENIFIWCFFLAILQLAIEAKEGEPYKWVKYVYIDDPISSLDEHNTIAVAAELGTMLKNENNKLKVIISTHHGLFFNVMFNELKGKKAYILHRLNEAQTYTLTDTGESPFLHHVAALAELQAVVQSENISQYHFHSLRSILEKTAIFFGLQHISACFGDHKNKALYARFLNVKSHAKYSVFESAAITANDKKMLGEILEVFLARFPFQLSVASLTTKPVSHPDNH